MSKYETWYMNSGIFTPNLNWLGDCIIEAAKESKNEASGPCRKKKQHNSCWACACNACAPQLVLTVQILYYDTVFEPDYERAETKMEAVR